METSLNIQLSTVGAYYPEQTLRHILSHDLASGRTLADIPPGACWRFFTNDRTYATLHNVDVPISFRLIAIVRDAVMGEFYPHMTIIPLFERDAELCHTIFGNDDIIFDWEVEPDGIRPPIVISIKNRTNTVTDATNLDFSNIRTRPTLPANVLKRNDIIVLSFSIELRAPILAPPSYSFIAHHMVLAHSSTDGEAGLTADRFMIHDAD
ncbi:hypothetical protein FKP32DRAFT_1568924 [Trametes sanguinea]|nr:hypothetical protein FKP32DRAFT_1568924 [Trametes sanguinea]